MKTHRALILSAAILGFALTLAPAKASAAQWSDDSIHVWSGPGFREPFDPDQIWKTVFTFTQVDGYKWGGNFLNVDWLASPSGNGDDVQGLKPVEGVGALEVYAVYRHDLSFNKISGTKTFEWMFLRDAGIVLGADIGTKNHAFSERKLMPTAGIRLALAVPGFWNIDLLLNKEWGVNGIVGQETHFNVTEDISTAWGIPFGPASFEGFGSVNFPKGDGGLAGQGTVTEILLHPKLMLDLGKFFGLSGYQIGVGYEYWMNKFGSNHDNDPTGGSYAHTVFGEVAIHL